MASTALLVTNDNEFARLAGTVLRAKGLTLVHAPDPSLTSSNVATVKPQLLVGDARGGVAAYEQARSVPAAKELPMILLVADGGESDALKRCASATIQEPIDQSELGNLAEYLRFQGGTLEAALAELRAGQVAAGLTKLSQLVVEQPGTPVSTWARLHAADARIRLGDQAGGAAELEAVLVENPRTWQAHLRLADLYQPVGQVDKARQHLQGALPFLGDSPMAARVQRRLGELSPTPAQAPAAAPVTSGPKVLVADDSATAREIVVQALTRAGYQVVSVETGSEAIEKAQAERPDLVVLDGLMPGVNGFDACKKVKRELYPQNPPGVIILTGVFTKRSQQLEAMRDYGADCVLEKSPNLKPLLEAAERHATPAR
ncbi:MAG: response regulator [Acidobacteriota bacterium]